MMDTDLQATCSALGYHEGSRYIKEPDCLETVKELIRFLRREDDTCDVRRQLGHAQILQNDLLYLVKQHHSDKPLFDTVIRLLVNLTQPVLVCFNNKLPDEKVLRQYCLEIESHLQQYKEAFVDEELFTVLSKKMTGLLQLDWEHRHEEDKLMLERMLVLVRNVLHIPPDLASEQRTDDDASLHDQILWAIHVSGMEDLLLYVASAQEERHLCMHVLEIISLMFREHSPQVLAFAGVQRSMTEKEKDERELEVARAKERAQKRSAMLRFNTRHSNFGGTYVMKNTKSLSDKELIYHKSLRDADNFTLDSNKKPRKKPKNRQPIKDAPVIRRSTLSIRLGLKEFCVQFLENAYNPLMYAVKDNLVREATQELDETYYLWAMQFFMEFCRLHSAHVDFVSETMSVTAFHYINNNLLRYYEMIMVEKKEAIVWGRRVHLALRAYQELLMTLDMMDRSSNSHLHDSAHVIKSNVFYMMEFRDIFITLLKKFNESKNSRSYLKDLVESTHLFLRMLERHMKGSGRVVVRGKGCKKKKKAAAAKKATMKKPEEPTESQLEDIWLDMSSQLTDLLQGKEELPQDVSPFDAASEVDEEQQRVDAMVRIHSALRRRQAGEAVAIFRAAREMWPERDEFGSQDISMDQEFTALHQIFMAPLPSRTSSNAEEQPEEEAMEEEELEEEEVEAARTDFEEEFDFTRYLMSYAKPEVLKAYVVLAGDFESNSVHTNHCVVKMLHRVAFDLGYIAMLFQASLFRVFQKVMLGPAAHTSKFKEWCTFGVHVMRKFSEVAQKNKKVFMEMMFWKGSKEAMQITEGYDYNPGNAKVAWTEDEENELMRLFEDFRGAENPEMDTVDMILGQWSGSSKTRGQIIRHLKVLRLITSVKDLRRKPESVRVWTADDEQELRDAFHTHKDSYDPLTNILESLSKKRSKVKVTEKLLAMRLVEDKKQLYKKRRGKSRGDEGRTERGTGSDDEDDSCDERNMESDVGGGQEEGGLPSDEEILSSPAGSEVSSDEDSDDGNDSLETSQQAPDEAPSSSSDTVKMLKNVVDKGYKEQVLWIHRLLGQNAKTRQGQEIAVSVPIVPLTEENETAMEDPVFTDFLQRLGLSPPANEQEMFWRIPASLTAANLQTIAEGLELDEDGEPVNQQTLSQLQPLTPRPSSSKTKKKEKKKKKKRQRDESRKTDKDKKKRAPKRADKKERKRKKRAVSVQSDPAHDSSHSDQSDGEDHQRGTGSDAGDDSAGSRSKGKGQSASQRREALKAMLERRKVKKILNRQRTRSGEARGDDQPTEEASPGTSAETSISSQRPPSVASSPPSSTQKNRKRARQAVYSDSDSDDNMETDHNKAEDHSPPKSTKRIRLLGSDLSDDDDNKENKNNSALNYKSDEEVDASQSQSQGLLDFGDDSDVEERKEKGNADGDESSDDDVPLMAAVKRKEAHESFPATMLSQGPPGSEDSDLDDHVTLGALKKKRKVISDDEDD